MWCFGKGANMLAVCTPRVKTRSMLAGWRNQKEGTLGEIIQFDKEAPATQGEDATLDRLQALVAEDLRQVNRVILEHMQSNSRPYHRLGRQALASDSNFGCGANVWLFGHPPCQFGGLY